MASTRRPSTAGSPLLLTALAMLAFAGNSLLCRAALRPGAIDATTFALVRGEPEARRLENQVQSKFGPCWTAVVPV